MMVIPAEANPQRTVEYQGRRVMDCECLHANDGLVHEVDRVLPSLFYICSCGAEWTEADRDAMRRDERRRLER